MGIPRTILPWIVLTVAFGGLALGLGMQWYTNGTEQLGPIWSGYQFKISGKPYFSLPANIPVTFEVIVLSSAFAAFFGMLILNGLPRRGLSCRFSFSDFREIQSRNYTDARIGVSTNARGWAAARYGWHMARPLCAFP